MPVTDYELALACRMASYRESGIYSELKDGAREKLEGQEAYLQSCGWARLSSSEEYGIGQEHGYYGVAFYRYNQERHAEIIIAHRGTCFNREGNIIADIEIAQGKQPAILGAAAYPYTMGIVKEFAQKKIPVSGVFHTGFSLGAFIAGACVVKADSDRFHAVTFDGPGIGNLQFNPARASQVTSYLAPPNLVNTANPQVGEIRHIQGFEPACAEAVDFTLNPNDLGFTSFSSSTDAGMSFDEMKQVRQKQKVQLQKARDTTTAMKVLRHTLDTHNLDNIIEIMERRNQPNLPYKRVRQWPTATNTFVYGEEPELGSFSGLDIGGNSWLSAVGSFVINAGVFATQTAKNLAAKNLWLMTARPNPQNEQEEGVIAVHHQCPYQTITYAPAGNAPHSVILAAYHRLIGPVNNTETQNGATRKMQPGYQ